MKKTINGIEESILINGDCLKAMDDLIAKGIKVDAVITDPPYGTTSCKWDSIIPFDEMWLRLNALVKEKGIIALTGTQPFSSALVMSNPKMFKYEWVWNKVTGRGHLVAKKRPMAQHENILVFGKPGGTYNPQMTLNIKPRRDQDIESSRSVLLSGKTTRKPSIVTRTHSYPKTIQVFSIDKNVGHPTQKPVALMEYLIKTYTNKGDTVLDFTMGSGTTGVACKNTNRKFIGIELDKDYFDIAKKRINES